jgi:enoyl-[acyl-carrier protein] reductase II
MEAAIALTGEVCGRIENVKPVADIIAETSREFFEIIASLTKSYGQQT